MSGLSLGVAKNFGTKRGFSDAIDCNGKWSGLDGDLSKGGVLFSPRAGNNAGRKSLGVLENNNNNNNNITQVTSSDVVVVSNFASRKEISACFFFVIAPLLQRLSCRMATDSVLPKRTLWLLIQPKNSGDAEGKSGRVFCGSHAVTGRDGLTESRLMDLLHGYECVLTYEDKDGDWMLVGDVPWDMFTDSCRRLRIMKGSEAIGLAPRAMEKCKSRN
ncbi:hypothetical protein IFM89_037875 [Coptis chinensis]|uniref:Auxin-responsive protein n=1 Tax=Coptis chinensis TaxID=261450 RepID=A0A835LWK4_9MAGN|nr:hypothetical protein IFM89_037875 [Coptis chinensis]